MQPNGNGITLGKSWWGKNDFFSAHPIMLRFFRHPVSTGMIATLTSRRQKIKIHTQIKQSVSCNKAILYQAVNGM